ncbi:MAG: glycosyltransferase [Lachnospiraceae bacterium]|nr:glycosyltransferase [Lachnospiraceae bacterium]
MKRLSVIIPVYNAREHIQRCVDSILPQLKENDELLLINDGSTDDSIDIIKKIEQQYDCVRVIDKPNEGVAKTRNLGIIEAKGEFICFIDNDDYVDKEYFETYYNEISKGKYDLVMGGYKRVTDQKVLFKVKPVQSLWYQLMVVAPWAKIYRRQFLIDHKITFLNYGIGEDNYFNFQVYTKTNRVSVINYSGYNWWFNDASISNTSQKGFNEKIDITVLLNRLIELTGNEKPYSYFYVRYVIWYLLFSGRKSNVTQFMKEYKKGIQWLKVKNISVRFPVFSESIKGETLKNRCLINIFILFHRMKSVKIFASIFCKG